MAGALPSFVFQVPGELKCLQNGPCATQIFTFGRRPRPPLRQGDSLDTPCSRKIWASARPKYKGSPCEELWHDPTEHRLSTPTTTRAARSSLKTNCQCPWPDTTRKQGSQHSLTYSQLSEIKKKDRSGSAFLLHLSPSTEASPSLVQRLSSRRATAPIRQSTGSPHPPTLSYSLLRHLTASEHKGSTLIYTHCLVSPTGGGAVP